MSIGDVRHRRAARALIIDERSRLLLAAARDPSDLRVVWFAPGGTLEPGETLEAAVRRELQEEVDGPTDYSLIGPIWRREHRHRFDQVEIDLVEWYFATHVHSSDVLGVRETGGGARYFVGWRWWALEELDRFDGIVAPRRLAELVAPIIRGDYPSEVISTGE
jgi:8-oxo-dGTP pyrophosphatase MutT (NUDIX family)